MTLGADLVHVQCSKRSYMFTCLEKDEDSTPQLIAYTAGRSGSKAAHQANGCR